MKIKYITCSGANEYTDIEQLLSLQKEFPKAEFGIQVSGRKCGEGSPRLNWLRELSEEAAAADYPVNLALHLNQDWAEKFCYSFFPLEMLELLSKENAQEEPVFQRLQLNFKIGREETPDVGELAGAMSLIEAHQYIVSYNESNAPFLSELYDLLELIGDLRIDCLYDNSHGEGKLPETYAAPVFPKVLQGYAGGLTPENVASELDKIAKVVPKNAEIFIDAEGGLKDKNGRFSIEKARRFLENALAWEAAQTA